MDAAQLYLGIGAGPRTLAAQLRAYRLLREQGAPEIADMMVDDFHSSRAEPADTADVTSGVASILVEEGRGKEAIALVDRALTVLPDDGLRLARGFLLERLDRVPEAVEQLRKVAERRPNDPMALNALGYTLVDRTKSVAEGTELIERAIAAKPDSYAIQDSMGWALVQSGRLDDGRTWLQKAWDLFGRSRSRRAPRRDAVAHGAAGRGEKALGRGARRESRQPAAQARDRATLAVTAADRGGRGPRPARAAARRCLPLRKHRRLATRRAALQALPDGP
jgi:Flp pilus assembly protein TadD